MLLHEHAAVQRHKRAYSLPRLLHRSHVPGSDVASPSLVKSILVPESSLHMRGTIVGLLARSSLPLADLVEEAKVNGVHSQESQVGFVRGHADRKLNCFEGSTPIVLVWR